MKTNPDPHEEEALLEAVLRDEAWQSANATGKAQALQVFHTRRRVRRLARWSVGLAVLAAGLAHWMPGLRKPVPKQVAQLSDASLLAPKAAAKPEKSPYLTDEQLLALFPRGSCFLAEVDGRKKLVFYDPAVEHEYVSDTGAQLTPAASWDNVTR